MSGAFRAEGNELFRKGEYDAAIQHYGKGIELATAEGDSQNELHLLYGNRSAAYMKLKQFDLALKDATKSVELKSTYEKVCCV